MPYGTPEPSDAAEYTATFSRPAGPLSFTFNADPADADTDELFQRLLDLLHAEESLTSSDDACKRQGTVTHITPTPTEWTPPPAVTVGSLPVGKATYPVPTEGQVLFVSPTGNNGYGGTQSRPKRTLQAAINTAANGAVIVLRAGSYHESLNISKSITVQAYPGEAVWLDGSSSYTAWSGSGPWTSTLGPQWVPMSTSGYPLTTYPQGNLPEQVWIDGIALRQIADGALPTIGQFSVNRTAHTVTIGSSPVGKDVRVADLNTALTVSAPVRFYGIGIRRYSPLVHEGLSALIYFGGTSQGSVVENCVLQDSHGVALNTARPITVRDITVQDCGAAGMQITTADGFVMERFVIRRCNRNLWKAQPITAGIKVTRTQGLLIRDGIVSDIPDAMGIWLDVSVTKSIVLNVAVDGASSMSAPQMQLGLHSELSDGGLYDGVQHRSWFVNCRVRNTKAAIKLLDAGWTNIANCKFEAYSQVGVYLQQDERRNTAGNNLDPKVVPWIGRGTGLLNNDIAQGGLQVIAYHDPARGVPVLLGWDFFDRIAGNWFRPSPPGSLIQLGKADGQRTSFNSLDALASSTVATGARGGKLGTNHQGLTAPDPDIAEELPAEITKLLGVPGELKRVGPFLLDPVARF